MWQWMHEGGMSWAGMAVLMLAFWVLIIAGIVLLIWYVAASAGRGRAAPGAGAQETPLEILKKRYARGEITRDQYQEMKRELQE